MNSLNFILLCYNVLFVGLVIFGGAVLCEFIAIAITIRIIGIGLVFFAVSFSLFTFFIVSELFVLQNG